MREEFDLRDKDAWRTVYRRTMATDKTVRLLLMPDAIVLDTKRAGRIGAYSLHVSMNSRADYWTPTKFGEWLQRQVDYANKKGR